jgi:glycine cleavage system regulatory protein
VGTLVLFRAEAHAMQRIRETCQAGLPALHASCHPTEEPRAQEVSGDAYVLTIYSFGRQGQLTETASLLEELGVALVGVGGCTYSAQDVGAPLFVVEMLLDLRSGVSLTRLSARLDELADRHGWDIDLRPERRRAGFRAPYPPLRHVRVREETADAG